MSILLWVPLAGQELTHDYWPYEDGEQITYKLYYNLGFVWVPAGEVIFDLTEQSETYVFSVSGRTFKSYDPFFKVRDTFVSTVDKKTRLPDEFMRLVQEGKYVRFDSLSFHQEEHKVEEFFGRTRAEAERFAFELDDVVHDMVSVIYHLRSHRPSSLRPGDKIPVAVFFDKEHFSLNVNYLGKENKRIKGQGRRELHHYQPELIEGYVFSEGDLMDIWVSDDGRNVPLMIESPISVGSIKAVLTGYKPSRWGEELEDYPK